MKNLMVLNNVEFGQVRMIEVEGKVLFCASDVAKALGYSNTSKAINDHCRYVTKCYTPHPQSKTKTIEMNFIPDGDIIRLAVKCPLPNADKFESWIFDEVIPSVLNNGGYISDNATEEQVEKLVENYSMRSITKQIHECDVMELEKIVNTILEVNCNSGKRNRADSKLKTLDKTEYKQHVRKHIRKAIESKPYSKEIRNHAVEMAIRDRLVIALADDVLATTNRKFGQLA